MMGLEGKVGTVVAVGMGFEETVKETEDAGEGWAVKEGFAGLVQVEVQESRKGMVVLAEGDYQ